MFKQNTRTQFDQYNNRQSQFQRSYYNDQSRYQNNVYQNTQFSSQTRQQNYQNYRNWQQNNLNQNQFSNVLVLLSIKQSLQITIDSTNFDEFNSNNMQ